MQSEVTLATAIESDNDFPLIAHFCDSEQCEPGYTFGPAIRNLYLIHYIVSGKGSYSIGKETYQLSAGDGFVIPPFVTTIYSADKENPWKYYWIGFTGPMAQGMVDKIIYTNGPFVFHFRDIAAMTRLFDQLSDHFHREKNSCSLVGYLYLFFSKIIGQSSCKDLNYYRLTEYISRNYMNTISMTDLCRLSNLSYSQIYRTFLKNTQQSPNEYLLSYRIARAQELLTNTNANITEICFSCGFVSPAYFTKIFRVRTGMTPSRYRKKADIQP